jgi:hypothetical protein
VPAPEGPQTASVQPLQEDVGQVDNQVCR